MTKVVKFPGAVPEKFGFERVRKKKAKAHDKHGQLNLFSGGKVVRLSQLTSFEEALAADEHGDHDAAVKLYRKAIHDGDSLSDAWCNLGILEFQSGKYSKAIDCLTRSLQNDPRHFEAHYNLANLYAEMSDYKLARFHYEVSIEIEPTFLNSYFNLALTLAMNKNYDEAIPYLIRYREAAAGDDQRLVDDLIYALQRSAP